MPPEKESPNDTLQEIRELMPDLNSNLSDTEAVNILCQIFTRAGIALGRNSIGAVREDTASRIGTLVTNGTIK